MGEHQTEGRRYRHSHHFERIHRPDEHETAEENGGDVVGVASRDRRLRFKRRFEQNRVLERMIEQEIRRDRSRDGRRGAPALAPRERESFFEPK
jgi:hypothetical protein